MMEASHQQCWCSQATGVFYCHKAHFVAEKMLRGTDGLVFFACNFSNSCCKQARKNRPENTFVHSKIELGLVFTLDSQLSF